ncbi:MAG TPA: pca operon transcription factor PcaQ [Bauldia sp.]|nr:pca operon transcription factor PcaQ [Bauldia sp.]
MVDIAIKFRHLNTFVEVARQRSVGRAAEVLLVSQPAVSKTLRELEAAVGTQLVERDGRGIRITRFGEMFLHHAGESLGAIRRGIDSVSRARASIEPPLRVGALPTVAARIMPAAIERYAALKSGATIRIGSGENMVLLEQLRSGQLDIVVGRLAAPEQMTGLNYEHLYSEQVVFAVRPGHPLLSAGTFDFSRIREFTVLMPTQGSIIRPYVERFLMAHGIGHLPVEIETISDAFGRGMLRHSDVIWIISEGVIAPDRDAGDIATLPIDTSETRGSVGLTTLAETAPAAAAVQLSRCLRDTVAALGL